jgi:hypothetical protein
MASFSNRSPISWKAVLLSAFILLLILTAAGNVILAGKKQLLTQATAKHFTQKLSVDQAWYLPPGFILLKDLSFTDSRNGQQEALLKIPWTLASFSPRQFVFSRRLVVLRAEFFTPQADAMRLSRFIFDNFSRIMDFIRSLPWQDIRFNLRDARFRLTPRAYISADCDFVIKGEGFSSQGALRRVLSDKGKSAGLPLQYALNGTLSGNELVLSKIELERENLRAQFWGNTDGKAIQINGFALANTLFQETHPSPSPSRKMCPLRGLNLFRSKPKKSAELIGLPKANFYLLDLDGRFQTDGPRVQIEHLNFSFNKVPVSLKGMVLFETPVSLDLAFSAYFENLKEKGKESLKKTDGKITGLFQEGVFNGDVLFNLEFVKKVKGMPPLEQLKAGFKGMSLGFKEYPLLRMKVQESDLFCKTDTNTYSVQLEDFNSTINLKNRRFKRVKFDSRFCDGHLTGQGYFETQGLFPRITAVLRARGVAAPKLDKILVHFSKVNGDLSSTMHFRNHPDLDLRGRLFIRQGYLDNFEFFKWLADFFVLPTLKRVSFDKASSDFLVNAKGAWLKEMDLESADVDIKGDFGLGQNDLVSSRLSLTFSRSLLAQSPKFTPLLRLLGSDPAPLCFDFQLSGILHKMNFRWLQSDFKKRLERAIPNFIERKIDREMEAALQSISYNP